MQADGYLPVVVIEEPTAEKPIVKYRESSSFKMKEHCMAEYITHSREETVALGIGNIICCCIQSRIGSPKPRACDL